VDYCEKEDYDYIETGLTSPTSLHGSGIVLGLVGHGEMINKIDLDFLSWNSPDAEQVK